MIERITGPLPDWADRQNPLLNYQLRTAESISARRRVLRIIGLTLLLAVLALGGYIIATEFFSRPPGQHPTESAVAILFYPMVIIQTMMGIAALALTIGAVGDEQRHLTWDSLRATPVGAALAMRTRWVAVFYRLRGPLGIITALRVILILGVLMDLTAFQGRYLDLLIGGITPDIPVSLGPIPFAVPVAALLLSLFLTASLLLPFTTIALDASLGLVLSTIFHQRVYSLIIQFMLFLLRILIVVGLVWLSVGFIERQINLGNTQAWLAIFSMSALADWGVMMLNLGFSGEMWAIIPYGIFIGPGLLLFALIQAFFADMLLKLAIRIAENRG